MCFLHAIWMFVKPGLRVFFVFFPCMWTSITWSHRALWLNWGCKKNVGGSLQTATYRLAHLPNQIAYKGLHHKACMAFTTQPKKRLAPFSQHNLATQSQKQACNTKSEAFTRKQPWWLYLKPFNNKTLSWLPTFPSSQKAFGTAIYQTLHTAGWQYNKQCQTSLSGMPTGVICKHYFASSLHPKGRAFVLQISRG